MRSSFWFKALRAARNLPLWFAVVLFAGCGGGGDRPVPQIPEPQSGDVLSSTAYVAPGVNGDGKLLVHLMPGINGSLIRATSLVFVPKGSPPVGGWPVVTWAHGTTTVGQPSCAPSLKPAALDGNLTTEGAVLGVEPSGYADLIAALVSAGYAVVAPDFEGLGTEAQAPYPYYSFSSLSRSLVAATRAAYKSVPGLSKNWAVVGHSDGGHAAVAVEKFAGEAPELDYKGAVAIAPFVSIRNEVDLLGANAASDPSNAANYVVFQNLLVGMMTTGLIRATTGLRREQGDGFRLARDDADTEEQLHLRGFRCSWRCGGFEDPGRVQRLQIRLGRRPRHERVSGGQRSWRDAWLHAAQAHVDPAGQRRRGRASADGGRLRGRTPYGWLARRHVQAFPRCQPPEHRSARNG